MYDFHYQIIKRFFGSNVKLLYSDTDSLFYEIITNDIYVDMNSPELKQDLNICKKQTLFRSKDHRINTITINKIAMNANDDKRHILDDGINTLAYGHYKLCQ
ncbi:uncharacterized protein LOC129003905 [Macrosteles quadrilineatus]|uniref:uncharacterized protein LOC129003905 n=1 Tax=Macrosteles quadrilineatus TaxID=74068 RepID=UPI0023E0BCB9|nr:uncharacterized protein LOC129003905 [Macrosteles quadrilineatus]